MAIDYQTRIPNNVDLGANATLQRALEHWQPRFLDWWREMGPSDFLNNLKTVLSRRLRSEFPQLRAAYRGKPVLWSPSYCIISAGGAPIEILRQYVENQKRPD